MTRARWLEAGGEGENARTATTTREYGAYYVELTDGEGNIACGSGDTEARAFASALEDLRASNGDETASDEQ
jgi:hypothetical protein